MKKTTVLLLTLLLTVSICASAFALPLASSAHYPRSGLITMDSLRQTNNTYAFKANGKTHNNLLLCIEDAYAKDCGTKVSIQVFIVNKWGNWIAFGPPKTIELSCQPTSTALSFPLRAGTPFCVVMTSYGNQGDCVIPYRVETR